MAAQNPFRSRSPGDYLLPDWQALPGRSPAGPVHWPLAPPPFPGDGGGGAAYAVAVAPSSSDANAIAVTLRALPILSPPFKRRLPVGPTLNPCRRTAQVGRKLVRVSTSPAYKAQSPPGHSPVASRGPSVGLRGFALPLDRYARGRFDHCYKHFPSRLNGRASWTLDEVRLSATAEA
jgi:hypothetical protein